MEQPASTSAKERAGRIEQRTLALSIEGGRGESAVGSIAYGLFLESDVVILNGIFSLLSLIGSGLSLLAARLVVQPENRRFPFGYSHLEPLVLSVNSFMALLAIPMPLAVLRRSLREVLLMSDVEDKVAHRLEAVMEAIRGEHDIVRYVHHVVKTGRTRFIEVDIVVGPNFALQTVAEQDRLRERIWRALGLSLDEAAALHLSDRRSSLGVNPDIS